MSSAVGTAVLNHGFRVILGVLGAVGGYQVWFSEELGINRIVRGFETGGPLLAALAEVDESRGTVEREALQNSLSRFFAHQGLYQVIVGGFGVGKSTAVRKALRMDRSQEVGPRGTLYCRFDGSSEAWDKIGEVCQHPDVVVSFWDQLLRTLRLKSQYFPHHHFSWRELEPKLLKAAAEYKRRHGHSPTLVIDDADGIVKNDWKSLSKLIQLAVSGAEGIAPLRMCFVGTSDILLPGLNSFAAKSYVNATEVPDISDAEAVDYLVKAHKVPDTLAKELVATVTGGRLRLLEQTAARVAFDGTVKYIQDLHYLRTKTILGNLGVAPDNGLFTLLLKDKCCSKHDALAFVKKEDMLDQLIGNGILSIHPNDTCTFAYRFVETFFANAGR